MTMMLPLCSLCFVARSPSSVNVHHSSCRLLPLWYGTPLAWVAGGQGSACDAGKNKTAQLKMLKDNHEDGKRRHEGASPLR